MTGQVWASMALVCGCVEREFTDEKPGEAVFVFYSAMRLKKQLDKTP